MGLLFFDGFDHYLTADITKKYTGSGAVGNATISASAARNGSFGMRLTSSSGGALTGPSAGFSARTQLVAGFALKITTIPVATGTGNTTICAFCEGGSGTPGIKIVLQSTGQLRIRSQSSPLTDNWTGTALTTGQWYYIEVRCKYTSSSALGDVEIKVDYGDGNGPVVVNRLAASQNTRYNGLSGGYTNFDFADPNGGSGWPVSSVCFDVDDFYLLDNSGSLNTSYLGNCKVETLRPDGAGASTQFTPSGTGGTNYGRVGETQFDGDTTYVSTSGVNNRDSYTFGDMTATPLSIFGVQVTSYHRADASETTRKSLQSLRISGTYYDAAQTGNLGGAYVKVENVWEQNPATVANWTKADIDGMEAGVKLVS